jgi:hypothetical protein
MIRFVSLYWLTGARRPSQGSGRLLFSEDGGEVAIDWLIAEDDS